MDIAILLFDRLTALDAVGPYEVLSRLPDANLTFVATEAGPKRTDTKALALVADATLDDAPAARHPPRARRARSGAGREGRGDPRLAAHRPRDHHVDDVGVHRLARARRRRPARGQARHHLLAGARRAGPPRRHPHRRAGRDRRQGRHGRRRELGHRHGAHPRPRDRRRRPVARCSSSASSTTRSRPSTAAARPRPPPTSRSSSATTAASSSKGDAAQLPRAAVGVSPWAEPVVRRGVGPRCHRPRRRGRRPRTAS